MIFFLSTVKIIPLCKDAETDPNVSYATPESSMNKIYDESGVEEASDIVRTVDNGQLTFSLELHMSKILTSMPGLGDALIQNYRYPGREKASLGSLKLRDYFRYVFLMCSRGLFVMSV